jgi:hypothetical protein
MAAASETFDRERGGDSVSTNNIRRSTVTKVPLLASTGVPKLGSKLPTMMLKPTNFAIDSIVIVLKESLVYFCLSNILILFEVAFAAMIGLNFFYSYPPGSYALLIFPLIAVQLNAFCIVRIIDIIKTQSEKRQMANGAAR